MNLQKKAMRKLCDEHRMLDATKRKEKKEKRRNRISARKEKDERKSQSSWSRAEKPAPRAECSVAVDFAAPAIVARRGHASGCAVRAGDQWYTVARVPHGILP